MTRLIKILWTFLLDPSVDDYARASIVTLADLGFFLQGVTLGTRASEASEH